VNLQEFEKRAGSIVEDELKNIATMVKKIPNPKTKEEADHLGLNTIDVDIKNNPLAFNILKTYVENMIIELVKDREVDVDYEEILKDLISHIMSFCVGYKAAVIRF
jgi:hypothetical protein